MKQCKTKHYNLMVQNVMKLRNIGDINKFGLMLQKSVYPDGYMDG